MLPSVYLEVVLDLLTECRESGIWENANSFSYTGACDQLHWAYNKYPSFTQRDDCICARKRLKTGDFQLENCIKFWVFFSKNAAVDWVTGRISEPFPVDNYMITTGNSTGNSNSIEDWQKSCISSVLVSFGVKSTRYSTENGEYECDNWDNKQTRWPKSAFPGKWRTIFFFKFLQLLINSGHLYQMMMNYQWENIEKTVI